MNLRKDHLHAVYGCVACVSVPSIAFAFAGVRACQHGSCTVCTVDGSCVVQVILVRCMLWIALAALVFIDTCLAMDALAQSLIKGAVNCNMHSDLQNSVNHLDIECGMRFWATP